MPVGLQQIAVEILLKAQQYMSGIKRADRGTAKFARDSKRKMQQLRQSWVGVSLAIAGVTAAIASVLRFTRRQVLSDAKLRAALRSTGEAAGLTFEQLSRMADGLQRVTIHGDEAIQEVQAMMLTFTNIGSEVFPEALESILNVSDALGRDLASTAQLVGRVLNDPINNLGALTRNGIQFTQQQRDQIRAMQQAGDVAGAQAIVLAELETQFGGMSRAIAQTDFGKFEQLKNVLGDIAEEIGQEMLPGLGDLSDSLKESAEEGGGLVEVFKLLGRFVSVVASRIARLNKDLNALSSGSAQNIFERLGSRVGLTPERIRALIRGRLGVGTSGGGISSLPTGGGGPADQTRDSNNRNRRTGSTTPTTRTGGGGTGPDLEAEFTEIEALYQQDLQNYKELMARKAEADRRAKQERINSYRDGFMAIAGFASNFLSGLSELEGMVANNRIAKLDEEYNERRSYIEKNVEDEGERDRQLAELQKEQEARTKRIRRKAAKKQRELQLYETLINIPIAAFKAFSSAQNLPYPASLVIGTAMAAATTALGFAKYNAIRSAPLPELATGGIIPGSAQGQPFIGGENNKPEAVLPLDRLSEFLPGNSGQMINVYVGNEQLVSHIDNSRDKKASRLGAGNYSFRSVYI